MSLFRRTLQRIMQFATMRLQAPQLVDDTDGNDFEL